MTIQFRHWLENDAEWLASRWQENDPTDHEVAKQNEQAIEKFVDRHADDWLNGEAIAQDLEGRTVIDLRYNYKPIAGNLLDVDDKRLGKAVGIVTNAHPAEFAFYMSGQDAGNLLIQHPPLAFDETDRTMLASIIRHEVGHAADWLNPNFKDVPPSGQFRFNWKKYAENIHEARQLASQLRFLLKRMGGDIHKVEAALQGQRSTPESLSAARASIQGDVQQQHQGQMRLQNLHAQPQSPFRLSPDLMNIARAFLARYRKQDEGLANRLAGPLLTAASLFAPQAFAPQAQPATPVAQVQEQNLAGQAAQQVTQIVTLLKFGNFVSAA